MGLCDPTFEDLTTLVTVDASWPVDKLQDVLSMANIVTATPFFL
jgi:hypothetical protein